MALDLRARVYYSILSKNQTTSATAEAREELINAYRTGCANYTERPLLKLRSGGPTMEMRNTY